MENKNNEKLQAEIEAMEPKMPHFNKKPVIIASVIALVVIAAIAIGFIINNNASKKADEAIALADTEMNDSIAMARYIDAAKLGHKSGNRAKLEVAIRLYQEGKYQDALNYLNDASTSSELIEAGKYALAGDCYVNLGQLDKALASYDKAISESEGNPQIIPFVLVKKANIYREQGKHNEEAAAYDKIFNEYPEYASNLNFDIRKYAERARMSAQK